MTGASRYESEVIVGQIWIAMGQGAGQVPISAAAVEEVFLEYQPLMGAMVDSWSLNADAILAYSRELGRLAAASATAAGSEHVDAPHMREAIEQIAIICPCGGDNARVGSAD